MSRAAIAIASTTTALALACASAPQPPADVLEAMAAQNRPPPAASSSAPAPSASAATPPPTAAGSCNFLGAWVAHVPAGPLQGQAITWTINADGTSGGQVGSTGSVKSKWEMSGSTLTTTDVSGAPPEAACPASAPGRYTVTFTPDCQTATLSVQTDACAGRMVGINQNPFKRQ